MSELSPRYNFQETESKWLKVWKAGHVSHAVVHPERTPFTVVIPPPNITGILHMGHALNNTLQDILVRYQRMRGFEALWMPGTDHAGIATQNVVEKDLAKEGKRRQDVGREEFLKKLWAWKQEYGNTIIHQLEKLGSSCDWDRARFTMDEEYSDAVKEVFIRLYNKNLIYQGQYIINWCPRCQTALSDEEAEHKEKNGKLYFIRYPFKNAPQKGLVVATTRPETMLGDTAVAVNPKDERYAALIGQTLVLPLIGREITIIADDFVDPAFGTGAVKVTPAHDPNDFGMGKRHHLEFVNILHPDGKLNDRAGKYSGLDRFAGRRAVVADLEAQNVLVKIEEHKHAVGHCYRCDTVVEPYLSKQWFVKMAPLARPALEAVKSGEIHFYPDHWEKVYTNWMENIRDWCISRQIWWGHRIPVWYDEQGNAFVGRNEAEAQAQAKAKHGRTTALKQDEDVLDTWFSSWLWPFATLGWPKDNPDLKYFYPTQALFTASEIIFFWVARMIMAGYEFMGQRPFSDVFIHGTVRDAKGRKMSKSLGNAIDPLEIIQEYGADALRFSLIINCGQDIFISKEKFEIGRNFANKIWNAARLVFMNSSATLSAGDYEELDTTHLDLPSRWILQRFAETLDKVGKAIESYRFSEAEVLVQEFFWGSFCDWYLELIKPKLDQPQVQRCALYILKNSLKMMHPFMPFVTEEIYSRMDPKEQCLSLAAWPKPVRVDGDSQAHIPLLIEVIVAIRNVRSLRKIRPQEMIKGRIVAGNAQQHAQLTLVYDDIKRLAKFSELGIEAPQNNLPAADAVVQSIQIFIPS